VIAALHDDKCIEVVQEVKDMGGEAIYDTLDVGDLDAQEQGQINEKKIISKKDYFNHFLGDVPLGLMGANKFFENGKFILDIEKSFEDKNFFAFKEYPLVAVISGDLNLSPQHPLVEKKHMGIFGN